MDDRYGELPERRIAAWQLVAYNMARFRKAAGMTGTELGALCGWTKGTVSAYERAWDGKRKRDFDAATLVVIATALRVPVAALLLPPEDDGQEVRYVLDLPGGVEADMATLMTYLTPEPSSEDIPAMDYYRQRADQAMLDYIPQAHRPLGDDDPAVLDTEDAVAAQQERNDRQRQAFREGLLYLGDMEGRLAERLAQIRGDQH